LPAAAVGDDLLWRDLRPVLDEEVSRLPAKYRAAFVLCCLEGRTRAEAAEQLRCPEGTVLSRLSRARERLRRRLLRRGVCLSVGSLAAVMAAKGQAAEMTARLVITTSKAALTAAAGNAVAALACTRAAVLTEGALRAMFLSKVKLALGILVAVGLVGAGTALIGTTLLADPPRSGTAEPRSESRRPAPLSEGTTAAAEEKPEPDDPADRALRRLQSQRKLKQIGVALHAYADAGGKFPAPAIYQGYPDGRLPQTPSGNSGGDSGVGAASAGISKNIEDAPPAESAVDRNAKPLLSWRVAILPFLGENDLYRQFKRNEPWDSEHNRQLLARMPAVYAAPGMKDSDRTYYQAIVGAEAAWRPRQQMRMPAAFPDGTSNTILVVEAAVPVPWTKPEDLPYVADQALPKLGGLFGGDFHALFADGAVQLLSAKADEQQLRLAIMPDDGYPNDFDKLLVVPSRKPGKRARIAEPPEVDATTAKLLEENAELHRALDRALENLEKLRAEKQRLEKQLQRSQKNAMKKPVD
jgi:hypothetical protein